MGVAVSFSGSSKQMSLAEADQVNFIKQMPRGSPAGFTSKSLAGKKGVEELIHKHRDTLGAKTKPKQKNTFLIWGPVFIYSASAS